MTLKSDKTFGSKNTNVLHFYFVYLKFYITFLKAFRVSEKAKPLFFLKKTKRLYKILYVTSNQYIFVIWRDIHFRFCFRSK